MFPVTLDHIFIYKHIRSIYLKNSIRRRTVIYEHFKIGIICMTYFSIHAWIHAEYRRHADYPYPSKRAVLTSVPRWVVSVVIHYHYRVVHFT